MGSPLHAHAAHGGGLSLSREERRPAAGGRWRSSGCGTPASARVCGRRRVDWD